ncbi:sensor domain-containing diguanylate cyclase [Thiohalobacter thiocyanaticus]|uniref:diguanylate cyclase n=2 Tax=Thiohalobacter thiocyanaticus TaxID=585455 RepID=A0A426QKP0_9GAMM|nr:sensor domain-containing diguanylate cyclase [Thiohalobacter thiocyanaticus]
MRLMEAISRTEGIPVMGGGIPQQLLYIDTPGQSRERASQLLQASGDYHLLQTPSLPEGMRLLAEEDFALVLLGAGILEADWRDHVSLVRTLTQWSPVIVLMDTRSETATRPVIEAGADDCLEIAGLTPELLRHSIRGAVLRGNRWRIGRTTRIQTAGSSASRNTPRFPDRAILDAIGDALLVVDEQDRLIHMNTSGETLLQLSRMQALGRPLHALVTLTSDEFGVEVDPLTLSGKRPAVSQLLFLTLPDGSRRPAQCSTWPLSASAHPGQAGRVLQIHDVSEIYKRLQKASYDASHDPLTGVLNRREICRRIGRALSLAREHDLEHSLIYFDLDGFKQVNDLLGHPAGDRLLREITRMLLDTLRGRDSIGRLGGDEFVLLLEYCSIEDAIEVADKIRDLIRGIRLEDHKTPRVSASISVVPVKTTSADVDTVLREADRACYQAKRRGKDCVEVAAC